MDMEISDIWGGNNVGTTYSNFASMNYDIVKVKAVGKMVDHGILNWREVEGIDLANLQIKYFATDE